MHRSALISHLSCRAWSPRIAWVRCGWLLAASYDVLVGFTHGAPGLLTCTVLHMDQSCILGANALCLTECIAHHRSQNNHQQGLDIARSRTHGTSCKSAKTAAQHGPPHRHRRVSDQCAQTPRVQSRISNPFVSADQSVHAALYPHCSTHRASAVGYRVARSRTPVRRAPRRAQSAALFAWCRALH